MRLLAIFVIAVILCIAYIMMKVRTCGIHQYSTGYSEDTVCEAYTENGKEIYRNFGWETAYNNMVPETYSSYRECRITVVEDNVTDLHSLTCADEPVYLGWIRTLDDDSEYHITMIKSSAESFMLQFPHHDPLAMVKSHEGKIVRLKIEII